MFRDALVIATKDLKIEIRSKVVTYQIIPLGLAVVLFFGISLNGSPDLLEKTGGGLYWIALLFTSLLAVSRSAAIESEDRAGEGLTLAGVDPAGMFLGKTLAVFAELTFVGILVGGALLLAFHLRLVGMPVLIVSGLLGIVGLASAGTIYGGLAGSTNIKDTILPLLYFPVVSPVVLAATRAWELSLGGHAGQSGVWVRILFVFALIYCVVGIIFYERILEI